MLKTCKTRALVVIAALQLVTGAYAADVAPSAAESAPKAVAPVESAPSSAPRPKTRAEVVAELKAARESGELDNAVAASYNPAFKFARHKPLHKD